MSCPDWPAATAWRRGDGPAPAEWPANLEHLAGCAGCRSRVAALDPTLLLAAAPVPEVDAEEAATIAATVRALVRSSRLEESAGRRRHPLVAAAAVAVLLATPIGVSRLTTPVARSPVVEVAAVSPLEPAAEPLIEEVQPAGARIYQFGSDDLPVVLIVDENLDL